MRNERVAGRMDGCIAWVKMSPARTTYYVFPGSHRMICLLKKSFSRKKLYKINNTLTFLSIKVYDIGFEYIISVILIYVFAVVLVVCCIEGDPQSHIW